MTDLRIGLVVEGPTDLAVFEELLLAYCRHAQIGLSLHFVNLQPSSDSSSGGGWRMVYKWCLNNLPQARRSQYFGPGLFDEDMNGLQCDVILVHLDADICEEIRGASSVNPIPNSASSSVERGTFIRNVILEWLWPENETPDSLHIPCPAVEMIETWLVASHIQEEGIESLKDVLRRLAEIDFQQKSMKVPDNAKSVRKSYGNYKRIAKRSGEKIEAILRVCPHFERIVRNLFDPQMLSTLIID